MLISIQRLQTLKKKIPEITNLATTAVLYTKASEMENTIPGLADLATKVPHNTKRTAIENKTPDSRSIKKPCN